MNHRTTSKSSLFLMELIIAILFFSLASAICIQLFVKAHFLDVSTKELNKSVLWTQNVAETFLGDDANLEKMKNIFPDSTIADDTFLLYLDDAFEPSIKANADYLITLKRSGSAPMFHASINMSNMKNKTIYSIQVDKYLPNGGKSNEQN